MHGHIMSHTPRGTARLACGHVNKWAQTSSVAHHRHLGSNCANAVAVAGRGDSLFGLHVFFSGFRRWQGAVWARLGDAQAVAKAEHAEPGQDREGMQQQPRAPAHLDP
eukprot:13486556-Alexandrium_andersonii.AAC.1